MSFGKEFKISVSKGGWNEGSEMSVGKIFEFNG